MANTMKCVICSESISGPGNFSASTSPFHNHSNHVVPKRQSTQSHPTSTTFYRLCWHCWLNVLSIRLIRHSLLFCVVFPVNSPATSYRFSLTALEFAAMPAIDSKPPSRPRKSYISSFVRWLQLKKYQYEVTFSLYMLTSTEKLIFSTTSQDIPTICLLLLTHGALDFILLVLISMLVTAATMYLPNHVAVIYNRI